MSLRVPVKARQAWQALSTAMDSYRPPCSFDPELWWSLDPDDIEAASWRCLSCRVFERCHAYATSAAEPAGVWAGINRAAPEDIATEAVATTDCGVNAADLDMAIVEAGAKAGDARPPFRATGPPAPHTPAGTIPENRGRAGRHPNPLKGRKTAMTYTDDPDEEAELRLLRDDLFGERPDTAPPDLTKGNLVPREGSNPTPKPGNLGLRFARELFGGDPNHGYTTDN